MTNRKVTSTQLRGMIKEALEESLIEIKLDEQIAVLKRKGSRRNLQETKRYRTLLEMKLDIMTGGTQSVNENMLSRLGAKLGFFKDEKEEKATLEELDRQFGIQNSPGFANLNKLIGHYQGTAVHDDIENHLYNFNDFIDLVQKIIPIVFKKNPQKLNSVSEIVGNLKNSLSSSTDMSEDLAKAVIPKLIRNFQELLVDIEGAIGDRLRELRKKVGS